MGGSGSNTPGNRPDGYPLDWDVRRRRVYVRDGYRCKNCGASDTEVHAHHVVPLLQGGSNDLTNLTTLCTACHTLIHPHMRESTYVTPWMRAPDRPGKKDTYWNRRDAMIIIGIVLVIGIWFAFFVRYQKEHPPPLYCDEIPKEVRYQVDCVVR